MQERMYEWKYLAIIILMAGLSGCVGESRDQLQVTPGKGVGGVVLGATRVEVLELLGQPVLGNSEQVADSLSRDEWAVGEGMFSLLFYEEKVIQVEVAGPAFTIPAGLSASSAIADIRAAYPDMEVSVMAHDLENMYLDAVEEGIAFSVRAAREGEPANADGDVIHAFVHPPGREVIAIVHHHESHH